MRDTLSSIRRGEKIAGKPLADRNRSDSLYANRVKDMKSSSTRDLMSILSRSGMVSLAGGFPDTKTFGEETFQEICGAVASENAHALQYGPTAGLEDIRNVIVDVMAAEGTPARPEDILVTAGAQQALDLLGKVFLDEGDAIICEGPTYAGALKAFSSYRPRVIHVPMDEAGIIPAAVLEALEEAHSQEIRVKFIYTIPNFQNPAGVTLAAKRRRELLHIAREYDLIVLEDNPYGMIRFEGEASPNLATLDQEETGNVDRVVYLGTFSKIFAPGVRLGWIHARQDILHNVNLVKQGSDLCSSNLSQMLVCAYFQRVDWRGCVSRLTELYRERRDAMLAALAEFMPEGVHWTCPKGGFFVWVTLPFYVDATIMLPQAVARNVAYVPGESFYTGGEGKNCMRLNFSFPEPENIQRAIESLATVVREQIETSERSAA